MLKNKIQILSTGPIAEELIKEAAENDIIIDEISFIKTEDIDDITTEREIRELSNQKITVAFTSVNAVNAVAKFITKSAFVESILPW